MDGPWLDQDMLRRIAEVRRAAAQAEALTQRGDVVKAKKVLNSPSTRRAVTDASIARAATLYIERAVDGVRRYLQGIDFTWLSNFIKAASEALLALLPPNVRMLPDRLEELNLLAEEEQLCLAWLPSTTLTERLLKCSSPRERESLLVEQSIEILEGCASWASFNVEEARQEPGLEGAAELLRSAIEAARTGHTAPAQALATNVTDSVLRNHLAPDERKPLSYVKKTLEQVDERHLALLVAGTTLQAVASVFRDNGGWSSELVERDPESATPYKRNVVVHGATPDHYTEAAALKAIMLAASVIALGRHPAGRFLIRFVNENAPTQTRKSDSAEDAIE